MPNTGNSSVDTGKTIKPLDQKVLTDLASFKGALDLASSAAGVSTLSVAAPMAREMNKVEVGDYDDYGRYNFLTAAKNSVALYGSAVFTSTRLTEQDYATNLQYVRDNNISNKQSDGLAGDYARLQNPVLNDLGVAKIQLGTAMEAVSYYKNNPNSFNGSDALDLLKYVNNTQQLAADLINPATTMRVSINLEAVIAHQADQWASQRIAGWQQLSDVDKAAFTAGYSTLGERTLNDSYMSYVNQGGDPGLYRPDLKQMSAAEYLTWAGTNFVPSNAAVLQNALATAASTGPAGFIDPSVYPTDSQTIGVTNVPGVTGATQSFDLATAQTVLKLFFSDQTAATAKLGADGTTIDQYGFDGVLRTQQEVLADGNSLLKFYNNNATANNTRPYREADITTDQNGKVSNVTVFDATQTAASVAQIFGSALGRALVKNNDQLGQAAVGALAGTVAGAIGARLAQAFSASGGFAENGSLVFDAVIGDVLSGENLVPAGAGAIASLLTAELGTQLHLTGFGAQMFNAAVGGYSGSILATITKPSGPGLAGFATDAIWTDALKGAGTAVSVALGRFLADKAYPADSHAASIAGDLAGALGSYVGLVVGNVIGGVLNFVIPGIGAFFGTVFGRIFADAFVNAELHPGAIHAVRSYGYDYSTELSGVVDDGNTGVSLKMANAVKDIVNAYLHDVNGMALAYSSQKMIGYFTNGTPYLYQEGWFPNVTDPSAHFSTAEDAVAAAAHDLLRSTEVIGGDLLVKRAHTAFVQTMHPDIDGHVAYEQSDFDALVAKNYLDLTTLGSDLRIAQDYEQYLNNREVINAVMAANPDSAFTAGWIATFARVGDLGLNHTNANDFLGGLVGYLDSVNKAGLGAVAANASVKQSGNGVTVEIKVPNGTEIPGALSVFADQVSQSSDASGTTLQFVFANNLSAGGFHLLSAGGNGNSIWFGGDGGATAGGSGGNDILVGGAGNDTIHGGDGWDFIDGGAGSDTLFGDAGNDILRGGTGNNDNLQGGQGDDTYVFNRGDGADVVYDDYKPMTFIPATSGGGFGGNIGGINGTYEPRPADGGSDSLVFGAGIRVADVTTTSSGNNLIVTVRDPANPNAQDTITLQDWALQYNRIEFFKFADGTTLNLTGGQASYRVPFGAALSRSSVAENSANGTVVGTVTGFDLDAAAVLSYSLSDNPGGRFAINASTGVITVANGSLLDFEAKASHTIWVRTADQSGHVFYKAFTIAVTDVSETSVIEGSGSTSLTVVDTIYHLSSGGSGPSLKYFGAAVTFGQTGAFVPIAAERTAAGYEVAWKIPGSDQYLVWSADAGGNYITNITGVVSGSSLALESLETTFQQDLNSDGIVGIPFIEGFGSTGLAVADHIYYLLSGGSGPSLKYLGAAVGFGQSGAFAPISAERTATGYEVAWKIPGADQYTVWSTDAGGNYLTNIVGVVSGSSLALESLEPAFQQDLNGDGIVGIPFIEGFGSTGLAVADHIYYLLSGGSGPSLKYFGAAVGFGQSGAFAPISAERTATGYDVAWKIPGADQYTVWNTDADGNYLTNITGVVSGSSLALESLETTFQQDLNSDGIVGIPFIEGFGSTGLAFADHIYYLLSAGSGPSLKYFGAPVAGPLGGYVPISAERTAAGYDVAWKIPGSDQYTVWSTGADGNYMTNVVGAVSGSSLALESLETTFQQDLNGDGIVGIPFIEGFGSTGLAFADHIYYLLSGGSGPSLKYFGAPIAGPSGGYVPISAEQTSTGYDVAWKIPGADQYTVWSTGADGNYISNIVGAVSGSSLALESLESTFQQDLNSDGIVGIPFIEGFGSTGLAVADHIYYLLSGGSGPSLKYFGATVGFGQSGAFAPIAAERTATGYDVAWKAIGADQYTVWSTDAAGNYLTHLVGVVYGSSLDLKILEPTFQQDLNGDGVIGTASAVIEGFGSTSLTVADHIYYLTSGGSGPSLKYLGATVGFGETGAFAPIAAEQTATGYDVAWKVIGADQYTVWSTDAAGNYISNITGVVPGNSSDLKSLEGTFHQDLNGDGIIGGSPVILDLDGNGIDITPLKLSLASFDMDGEAGREHTAWAGNNDGLLAIDLGAGGKPGPDGVIDQTAEIVFTQWSPGATSDMAALREVFDTNHNGSLDHGDARWSEFRVWQDANGDGVSQAGEVKTLDAWGIASIGLEPAGPARLFSDGSAIQGFSSFTRTDGTTGAAGDVSLAYQHGAADTPGMMAPAFGDMIWHHVDGTAATLESEPINPTSLPALHNDWHIA
jgi:hypothetical protein